MKIGIYSDAHFSKNSSILVGKNPGSGYTRRLENLIQSFGWMYRVFTERNVDLIINCGDMTSSETISSEENSALAEALSFGGRVPEIHLLGNHEIKDAGRRFSSVDLLGGYAHCRIIRDVEKIDIGVSLVFLPYTCNEDSINAIQERLLEIDRPSVVFSHLGYLGEGLLNGNGFIDTNGIDKDTVLLNANVRKIFNGHLHNPLEVGNYIQIGSLIGNGFGDSYRFAKPRILVYDTESDVLERIVNPNAILFYKMKAASMTELRQGLMSLGNGRKCVQAVCPLSLRERVSEYIASHRTEYQIEEFRVKSEMSDNDLIPGDSVIMEHIEKISDSRSVYDLLKLFTECSESTPAPMPAMLHFLEKYIA